jgi:hypothetical protein
MNSLATRLLAISENPGPALLADLPGIALLVNRMEQALDDLVADAMANARGIDSAPVVRRGRFSVVAGGRP